MIYDASETIVALSVAQYRLLGRIIRGERVFDLSNYRQEHATVFALWRKGYIQAMPFGEDNMRARWVATNLGRKVYDAQGKPSRFFALKETT